MPLGNLVKYAGESRDDRKNAPTDSTSSRFVKSKRKEATEIGSAREDSIRRSTKEVAEMLNHRVNLLLPSTFNLGFPATGLRKNAVSYFWGSASPMTPSEKDIHASVASGLGFRGIDVTAEKTRPFYELGSCTFSTGLRMKAIILAPTLASSCVSSPPHIGYGQIVELNSSLVDVIFPSSSGSANISLQQSTIGPVLKGRFSLLIATKLHELVGSSSDLRLISINLSSSFVYFFLSHNGRVWQAQMSEDSISVLSKSGSAGRQHEMSNAKLFVRPSGNNSQVGSHLKVSTTGFCTYVGKPSLVESTYFTLLSMFKRVMNSPSLAVDLLKSLDVHPSPELPNEVLEQSSS